MTPSARPYDVLLFGEYFCDLIITGLPELPRLGADLFGTGFGMVAGGSFNGVRAMHRLGLRVGWASHFGNDIFSRFVLDEVEQEGVDPSLFQIHPHPVRSVSVAFSYAHDRGFISYMDPWESIDRLALVRNLRPKMVFLCGFESGLETLELASAAHEVGTQIAMDGQGSLPAEFTPDVEQTLRSLDVFLPNAGEAMQLTKADTTAGAADCLAELVPLVVVKQGADGVYARQGQRCYHAPAFPVQVLDTTGAGDCFNAGFLYGYLQGEPLDICLTYGNICGGISTTAFGASAAPTLDELLQAYHGSSA